MKKAVVIYNSKTGTTKKYAEGIGDYLKAKGLDVRVSPIQIYKEDIFDDPDYVFLGCWTSGLFVILQHPEAAWVEFAEILPSLPNAKLALFTTYKILTGSMFKNMYQHLEGKFSPPTLTLKSRSEKLTEGNKQAIDAFIAG